MLPSKPTLFWMEKLMKLVSNERWYGRPSAYALISLFFYVSILDYQTLRNNEIKVYAWGTLTRMSIVSQNLMPLHQALLEKY
jgi:hypothetical protein